MALAAEHLFLLPLLLPPLKKLCAWALDNCGNEPSQALVQPIARDCARGLYAHRSFLLRGHFVESKLDQLV